MTGRARRGFTLVEMTIVLLILTICSTVVVPALISFGADRELRGVDIVMALLRDSRRMAIDHAATVNVIVDPETGHFRVDSISAVGAGLVIEDTLRLGALDRLESDLPRLRYSFSSGGSAFGDSVVIRGSDSTRVLFVDPLSGSAYAIAR